MSRDSLIAVAATLTVLFCGFAMAAGVKTLARTDVIVTELELPKLRPVVEIYEFHPDEELPPHDPNFAHFAEDQSPFQGDEYPVIQHDRIFSDEEKECMAKNIYFEAKNQSLKGQVAVALVTLNRVRSSQYPNTVCDVVWQQRPHPTRGHIVAQFSWTWDGKPDSPSELDAYQKAVNIANAVLHPESSIFDFTHGSDHYHADYVNPSWAEDERMYRVVQIETHIFYRDTVYASM